MNKKVRISLTGREWDSILRLLACEAASDNDSDPREIEEICRQIWKKLPSSVVKAIAEGK